MTSEKFRRQLRQEAEQWWKEGLIDAELYGTLSDRYRFSKLESEASSRFTTILIGLGGILLGLGVISFVAANWMVWSREVKLTLLMTLFVGINAIGFYLWRSRDRGGTHKLGAALLLLGGLVLGANIALVSQMFHQSGPLYQLFLVWSAGVWLMAVSLALPSLGILSALLVSIAYVPAIVDAANASDLTVWHFAALYMPSLALLLWVPLACRCGSNITFGLTAVLVSGSIFGNIAMLQGWAIEGAIVLPPALLWAYSVRPPRLLQRPAFDTIARSLAILILASAFYLLSFNQWMYFEISDFGFRPELGRHIAIEGLIVAAVTLWLWLRLLKQLDRFRPFQARSLNTGIVALMLLISGVTIYVHLHLQPLPVLAPLIFNILLFFLAISAIRDGLGFGSRRTFWGGMVLLVVGIVTRMLEYDTGLLLKSLVFVGCGIGVILAGLWFERNVEIDRAESRSLPEEIS